MKYYFNSIKVRLELTIFDNGMKPQDYFNSIKVRLEHNYSPMGGGGFCNFNSIKVRLELIQHKIEEKLTKISIP